MKGNREPDPAVPGAARPDEEPSDERQLELERRAHLAEAELRRIYASRQWRSAQRFKRLQLILDVWRQRASHPVHAVRQAATRLLPYRARLEVVRLLRRLGLVARRPARQQETPDATKLSPPPAERRARPAIICLPLIEWTFRHQRPQQILTRLASRGWNVYYGSLTLDAGAASATIDPDPVADGVRTFRLPSTRVVDPSSERLARDDVRLMAHAFNELRRREHLREAVILCHSPFWRPLAHVLHRAYGWPIVYDRMDLHSAFPTGHRETDQEEKWLLADADLVTVTSGALGRFDDVHPARVVHLPNACEWEHWADASPSPVLSRTPRPIIGYFGAIAEWFDVRLVEDLALARPGWSFVLVGSTYGADTSRLEQLENVHLLGERPYAEIPSLAAAFDVGIIPFRRTPLTEATDPVKLYEMMSLGLDVVATPLPELEAHGPLLRLAEGSDEFLAAIEEALRTPASEAVVERRREFARANTWDARVDALEGALGGLYPRVSIAIVTYNNLAYTRLCLASIEWLTEYPSYEIIIVDNASTDGTRDWLEEERGKRDNLTVVLNKDNRGFASACNQAVRASTGDILCFLNNDTVVTRGWLGTMVAALLADPAVGLVGPSSNGVANEARVDVPLNNPEHLHEWAADHTWRHDGEEQSIPMLALYCAALRREVWEKVGELDERFEVGMFEDDDFSRRVRRAGYDLRFRRDAFVYHWQQASFGALDPQEYSRIFEENRRRYRDKWRIKGAVAFPGAASGAGEKVHAGGAGGVERELPVYDSDVSRGFMRDTIDETLRYRDLLRLLVTTNIKTRYKRSFLGVAWTLLNPLLMMTVMTLAFSALFRYSVPHYPVYVLSGLLFWTFFQQSTTQSMTSLVWGSSLLNKVYLPASVFPLSAIGTGLVNLVLSLAPLLLIMIALKQPFTWALLFVPCAVLLLALFSLGLGLLVSSLAVFFADVVDMYGVVLRIWFYLTPVMYPEKILPDKYIWLVKLNPMYHLVRCWRDPIYLGQLPPMHSVLVCSTWALGITLVGWWVFSRQSHQFALRA
ncbi:MAG: glycosyltransferase [Acidobacteria bacterium]|nr:glycosyltransferase [Acidobacteriota bacterium]